MWSQPKPLWFSALLDLWRIWTTYRGVASNDVRHCLVAGSLAIGVQRHPFYVRRVQALGYAAAGVRTRSGEMGSVRFS